MIVYQASKQQFLSDHDDRDLEEVIQSRFVSTTGRRAPAPELRAWRESLGYMARVLRDETIPSDAGIAVEYHIPQTSKRIDMTVTGFDELGQKNAVVIELKQWERAHATKRDAIVITFLAKALREVVHPSYQAWTYARLLEGFNEAVYSSGISIHPCAYLHNYVRDGVIDSPFYQEHLARAPVFLKGEEERELLRSFIRRYVSRGDKGSVLYEIDRGKIKPSKALADSLAALLDGKPEFVLIDEQKQAYEAAIAAVQASVDGAPRVVIVEGGPGTGKSVVAINLLVALTRKGLLGKYVSKNAAPREVYQAKLTGTRKKTGFSSLFSGSGSLGDVPRDTFQFLIVDEAHRLNERSGLYGNLGENQIKELVGAARCTIFFIDEDQRVTLKDIGSKERIRAFAAERGATVEEYELPSQFRCGGADGYLAWLDNTLGIKPTANASLDPGSFEFRVFDSPESLHEAIRDRNGRNAARVVAGYCWPWKSKTRPAAFDIELGGYRKRWNLMDDGSLWIIAPNSVEEVGCIHTCQGLELDYIGVIVGPDLVARDGVVVTDPLARDRHDRSMKGFKSWFRSAPDEARAAADAVIKNTYRTLMTRGMKGCFIYATDDQTRQYFRDRLVGQA